MAHLIELARRGRQPLARRTRWQITDPAWRTVTCGTPAERRLLRAYLALFLVAANDDGFRYVPLARFGTYEVRLSEFESDMSADLPPFWLELYAHVDASTLDSCGLHELEEAVTAADHLVAQARELDAQARDLDARSLRPGVAA